MDEKHTIPSSLCEPQNRRIPVRGCEQTMRKEQTVEVPREEKQLRFYPWMNNNRNDSNGKCMSLQHSRGEENACVRVFSILDSTMDGVCVWVRTDSPTTPLPKPLTTSTTSSHYSMKMVG